MAMVQCFVASLMLSAHLGLSSPLKEEYYWEGDKECKKCPPGQYQKSCVECSPCPSDTFTSHWNTEASCYSCFRDCKPDVHLKVVKKCTNTTDLRCRCEADFNCTEMDTHTQNCRNCEKIPDTATTVPALISVQINQTGTSSGHSITSSTSCLPPNCGSQLVAPEGNATHQTTDMSSNHLAVIFCSIVAMVVFIALVILFCAHPSGDEVCFKQAISKLCNMGGRDALPRKTKESTRQQPGDPSSVKHQPFPLTTANLGPVHVHNAGTVIFSLLSQVTGLSGDATREGEKRGQKEKDEEEGQGCPVFHPTCSPSIHLSQEERSGEADTIFFPSQEQGKDCQMSKEEVL